jgi:hypothetical protein
MANGESAPKDWTQRFTAEMEKLRQTLGAEKFAQVEGLASRIYEVNRRVLDIAKINRLITDEDYKKCLARGNEFTPIGWIMNDLLE